MWKGVEWSGVEWIVCLFDSCMAVSILQETDRCAKFKPTLQEIVDTDNHI